MSKQFRFKLTLEVEDYGCTSFSASGEADSQDELSKRLAWKIAVMLRILNDPPSTAEIADAIEGTWYSAFGLLALLEKSWDGCCQFEDALSLSVDVEKLCSESEDKDRVLVRRAIQACSWAEEKTPPISQF